LANNNILFVYKIIVGDIGVGYTSHVIFEPSPALFELDIT